MNTKKTWNELNNESQEYEYLIIINNFFDKIDYKIEKIKTIFYEILENKPKPEKKKYQRSLKKSK